MSPIVIKILIQVIMKFGAGIALTIVKELAKSISEQRASLTPEQRKEWDEGKWVKDFQVGE
jgi:hypothetical protein